MPGHNCEKEEVIGRLDERSRSQQKTINEFSDVMKKNNELLEQVAVAITEIGHLREDQHRLDRSVNELFKRMRSVELSPGRAAGKAWWVMATTAAGCVGGIISGSVVWILRA